MCFRLKIASSRSCLPHDATGEKMAAMQTHAAYRHDEAAAWPVVANWAIAADGTVRRPSLCRRNSI